MHEIGDACACLCFGGRFDAHGELGWVLFEDREGEAGFGCGVGGESGVGGGGGVDGDVPDSWVVDGVGVGVVGGDVVGVEFVGDVVLCFGFVFCFAGVGDECVGWGVVDCCDVVEVADEVFDGVAGVFAGVGDCGFYGVGGVFVHDTMILV